VMNLYATPNVASGNVVGTWTDRHRQQEYNDSLRLVDRKTSKQKVLHPLVGNALRSWYNKRTGVPGRTARAIHSSLHAYTRLVAEPGDEVVRRDHD
jgi:hypothetical protein